jgi:hypothetical protein
MKPSELVLTGLIVAMTNSASGQPAGISAASMREPTGRDIPTYALTDCDYNTCGLRMKLSWGTWRIIRGEREEQLAKLGMFRTPNLESIFATSLEAQTEVRAFRDNYMSGEFLQAVGVVLMGAGIASASANESAVIPFTGVLGGGALLFYGVTRSVRAFNALNKAIWLYNRSLKR